MPDEDVFFHARVFARTAPWNVAASGVFDNDSIDRHRVDLDDCHSKYAFEYACG
jgi:hypothetical protein